MTFETINENSSVAREVHKMPKNQISRKFVDAEGQMWGLHGATKYVGIFKIVKELKHHYVGYFYGITHDTWKQLLSEWSEVR